MHTCHKPDNEVYAVRSLFLHAFPAFPNQLEFHTGSLVCMLHEAHK